MDILKQLVPNCTHQTQSVVLERTIEYIEQLKAQYNELLSCATALDMEYKNIGGSNEYLQHLLSVNQNTVVDEGDIVSWDEG